MLPTSNRCLCSCFLSQAYGHASVLLQRPLLPNPRARAPCTAPAFALPIKESNTAFAGCVATSSPSLEKKALMLDSIA